MTKWLDQLVNEAQHGNGTAASWLDSQSPILIYGTGMMARDIYTVIRMRGRQILGFVDHRSPTSPLPEGCQFFTSETAAELVSLGKIVTIVFGIHNRETNLEAVIDRLNARGHCQLVSPVELYDAFGDDLGTRFWLTSRAFYRDKAQSLELCLRLWHDDKSRALFRSIVEFRVTGDVRRLPLPDLRNQYHPADIPPWRVPLRFIDCGAFDGDTLASFIHANIPIEAVAAFEPDLANFGKLSTFCREAQLPNVSLWPCGVLSSSKQVAFEADNGSGSAISRSGRKVIQCVALDEVLPTFAPNLIKMDIEGAEYEALLGTRHSIQSHIPGLAISLYHKPEHLWQLPLLVEELAPGKYQFFLRSHAFNDFELVLYAVPTDGTH